jgi:hypothetical protein
MLISEGLVPHTISIGMLSQDAMFASDHRYFFMDLDAESYFGHETDAVSEKQLRRLHMDDPMITTEYRQQMHHLLTCHNGYIRLKTILEWSISGQWSIEDEGDQYICSDKMREENITLLT